GVSVHWLFGDGGGTRPSPTAPTGGGGGGIGSTLRNEDYGRLPRVRLRIPDHAPEPQERQAVRCGHGQLRGARRPFLQPWAHRRSRRVCQRRRGGVVAVLVW